MIWSHLQCSLNELGQNAAPSGEQDAGTKPTFKLLAAIVRSGGPKPTPGKKVQYRMDESKKFILLNIEYYQRLLAAETDPKEREAIARLLAKQQAKLQERERKGRGT